MGDAVREYFKTELEHFQKAYELQFNHFMGVFYFWIGVVTLPSTAGLLTTGKNIPLENLALLSLLIAIVSLFTSLKMFDIRCSQLIYTFHMNEIRHQIYDALQKEIPSYEHPFPNSTDLRDRAHQDFGAIMAFVMSVVNAIFFGFSIYAFFKILSLSIFASLIWFLIGSFSYRLMVDKRVPKPNTEAAQQRVPPTGGARRAKKGVH
jgi:hypothetical protein